MCSSDLVLCCWAASCPTSADGALAHPGCAGDEPGSLTAVPAVPEAATTVPAAPTLGETIRMIIAEPLLLVRLRCDDTVLATGSKSDTQALAG